MRTVKGLYTQPVDYGFAKYAKAVLPYPVIVNGDIKTAQQAMDVVHVTGADGVMIGRAAISNPWIFRQIDEKCLREAEYCPNGEDYMNYFYKLCQINESSSVAFLKKYMVPVASFVDDSGAFANDVKHSTKIDELANICENFFLETYDVS